MIRVLAPDDLAGVAVLDAGLFAGDAWDTATWSALLATSGRRAWVATEGEQVVGCALTGVVGDFGELLRIGVHPAARRRGLGRELLATATRAAVADGAERMLLEVADGNDAAIALYTAAGFEVIDVRRRYYRDGRDGLVLQCTWGDRPLDRPARKERG